VNEVLPEDQSRRIVVALDSSSYSLAALRAAAELASLLDIHLEGLFVEDINLFHLGAFPYSQEVGSYTGAVRRIENVDVERQLRTMARVIQRTMNSVVKTPVRWTFQVRRGSVVNELLAAAQGADMISIGRSGYVHRSTLGSTARALVQKSQRPVLLLDEKGGFVYPLIAIYTGSATSRRGLQWLTALAQRSRRPVRVIIVVRPDTTTTIEELETEASAILGHRPVEYIIVRYGNVLATLRAYNGGTLVLPSEYIDLVSQHTGPTIVVP
jgi:nucleotide-binding universal stress UspA family protein